MCITIMRKTLQGDEAGLLEMKTDADSVYTAPQAHNHVPLWVASAPSPPPSIPLPQVLLVEIKVAQRRQM